MADPFDRQELDNEVDVSSFGELGRGRARRKWNGMGTPTSDAHMGDGTRFIICFRSPRTRASRDRGGGRHHHQQPATWGMRWLMVDDC
jgi:hypothetical protein